MTRVLCGQPGAANATRAWAIKVRAFEVLGPMPCASLTALEDLGLTDAELARYLRISVEELRQLRRSVARPVAPGSPAERQVARR